MEGPCGNNPSCQVVSTGSAVRNSAIAPLPIVSNGNDCILVKERTYSGTNACGLNEVTLDINIQNAMSVITLEPLGANGTATFIPNATDPAVASSVNNNLTILGQTGYACNLECSAPLLFNVVCRKEGAASCTEKF